MLSGVEVTRETTDADLQFYWETMIQGLKAGSVGIPSPFVYSILFERKIRRLLQKGISDAEASRLANEQTLTEIGRIQTQLFELVASQHRAAPVNDGLAPLLEAAEDEDELSPGDVAELDQDRQLRQADPDEVRRALRQVCTCLSSGRPAAPALNEFFCRWVGAFLNGKYRTLDQALGLMPEPGRSPEKELRQIDLAADVLRLRLEGKTFEGAVTEVTKVHGASRSVVARACRDYKESAACIVEIERALSGADWTPEQKERWKRIFPDELTAGNTA